MIAARGGGRLTFRSTSYWVLFLLCAGIITFGAVFYMWQRYQYIRLGFQVSSLREQRARLEERIEPLQVEVEYLSRLERIETLARETLGMKPPRASQIIVVDKDVRPAQPLQ